MAHLEREDRERTSGAIVCFSFWVSFSFPTPHRSFARSVSSCVMQCSKYSSSGGASFEIMMAWPAPNFNPCQGCSSQLLDRRCRLEYLPASPKYASSCRSQSRSSGSFKFLSYVPVSSGLQCVGELLAVRLRVRRD